MFLKRSAEGVDEVEHGAFTGFVELLQYFGVAEFAALVFGHEVGQVAVNAAGTGDRQLHTPRRTWLRTSPSALRGHGRRKGWRSSAPMSNACEPMPIK